MRRRLSLVLAATLLAPPAAALAAPAAAAPRPAASAPADEVSVVAGWLSPDRISGQVVSGGVAVTDSIDDYGTASVSGRATLTGDVRAASFAITKGLLWLGGTISVDAPGRRIRVEARVDGGVTRVSDDTIRWSGLATVTRGTASGLEPVTVTVVDRVVDPGTHAVTLVHAGQTRNAVVHVPARRARPLPTLFHFPGLLESPANAETFGHLRASADGLGHLLVIPAHYGIGWQGVLAGTPSPDVDDPGYVRALARAVVARFGADRDRLYASGMSNGGFFTSLLGCRLADVFAAFAPVAGQLNEPAACAPGRPVPIVMFHGDADPIVSYDTVAPAASFWAANNGCATGTTDVALPDADPADGTTVVERRYRDCPAAAPVVVYRIVGGGHVWPGGDPYPIDLGPATRDISANRAIWDFVSRFTLR